MGGGAIERASWCCCCANGSSSSHRDDDSDDVVARETMDEMRVVQRLTRTTSRERVRARCRSSVELQWFLGKSVVPVTKMESDVSDRTTTTTPRQRNSFANHEDPRDAHTHTHSHTVHARSREKREAPIGGPRYLYEVQAGVVGCSQRAGALPARPDDAMPPSAHGALANRQIPPPHWSGARGERAMEG